MTYFGSQESILVWAHLRRQEPGDNRNPEIRCMVKTSGEIKTKPLFNRKVQLAFGSAFVTLLIVGAVSYRGMVVSSESDRWVRHTHEVLETLQDLLFAMESIE